MFDNLLPATGKFRGAFGCTNRLPIADVSPIEFFDLEARNMELDIMNPLESNIVYRLVVNAKFPSSILCGGMPVNQWIPKSSDYKTWIEIYLLNEGRFCVGR